MRAALCLGAKSSLWNAAALCLFLLLEQNAFALGELFSLYDSPQALMMGNATVADSRWYTALFQNPAGLSQAYRRDTRRQWAVTPLAVDWIAGLSTVAHVFSEKSMQWARLMQQAQGDPGSYYYSRLNIVPSVTHRNFGFAALATSEFVATSDGTNVDVRAGNDVGMVTGVSSNFFGNLVKVGISGKAILRNQLQGSFAHSALPDPSSIHSNMKEGLGVGMDAGILMTAPLTWLPTIGLVVKDIGGTHFAPTRILNQNNNGQAPDSIAQSVHAGFMMSPILFRGVRANITADLKYLNRADLPLAKKFHLGMEIIAEKRLYVWMGLNQTVLPTFGLGLRTVGGDLEVGTYAQDVLAGEPRQADRRIVFRYTVGW